MIQSDKYYSAREIAEEGIFYWVKSYKSVLRYIKNPEYQRILKPTVLGDSSGTRYYIKGSALKVFIGHIEKSGRNVERLVKGSLSRKMFSENWQPAYNVVRDGLVPGIKSFHTFKKHYIKGQLHGMKVKVIKTGERLHYFVKIDSVSDISK